MRHFQQLVSGVDVVPLLADLHRQPDLWNAHPERTWGEGPFKNTDDIWIRFRYYEELVSAESYGEPFSPVFYPAWYQLPKLRPLVFSLMARLEAVQLGAIFVTRVPPGQQVKPHDDRGRWHAEFFETKVYIPLATNEECYNTCGDERVVMKVGDVWLFNNLIEHSTVNDGETDRV